MTGASMNRAIFTVAVMIRSCVIMQLSITMYAYRSIV